MLNKIYYGNPERCSANDNQCSRCGWKDVCGDVTNGRELSADQRDKLAQDRVQKSRVQTGQEKSDN